MTGNALVISAAVLDVGQLIRAGPADVAEVAASVAASVTTPDTQVCLWHVPRIAQRERHSLGVLLLHFVAGGLTSDEEQFLDCEVAEHRRRRATAAIFPRHSDQIR